MRDKYNDWLLWNLVRLRAIYEALDCSLLQINLLYRVWIWIQYHMFIRLPFWTGRTV